MLRVSSYRRLFEEESWSRNRGSSMQCAEQYRSSIRSVWTTLDLPILKYGNVTDRLKCSMIKYINYKMSFIKRKCVLFNVFLWVYCTCSSGCYFLNDGQIPFVLIEKKWRHHGLQRSFTVTGWATNALTHLKNCWCFSWNVFIVVHLLTVATWVHYCILGEKNH